MPRTAIPTAYRVYYMPSTLIAAWRKARDRQGTTNLAFVADAIDSHLVPVVRELRAIGMTALAEDRHAVRQPIPSWLMKELIEYAHGKAGKLFPGAWFRRGAEMLRVDLAAAGIPFRDSRGRRLDFHALRHSYVTGLARKGVSPKALQKLARHSTITLTMGVYNHLDNEELAQVVEEAFG